MASCCQVVLVAIQVKKTQEVIQNTPGCRLSCKSVKRKSCFEEQTPFCGLLLVSILNSCLEYRLNEVSCAYLHFLSVLPKTLVKYKSSRFFYRQTRSFSSPSQPFLKKVLSCCNVYNLQSMKCIAHFSVECTPEHL